MLSSETLIEYMPCVAAGWEKGGFKKMYWAPDRSLAQHSGLDIVHISLLFNITRDVSLSNSKHIPAG